MSDNPMFAAAAREHFYIAWLWWPVGLVLMGPTGLEPRENKSLKGYSPRSNPGTARGNRPRISVFL